MGTTDRRERHRASLRREILDAASRLFAEEGYQRVTMRRVAERIDYSPTTIYLYFRDKRELFGAICDETFSQLATKLERLKATPGTPLGHLREGLRTYLEFGTGHPNHYVVTFLQMREPSKDFEFEGSAGARAFGSLREAVGACAAAGDIRTESVETTAQALWAAVHGLTALLITMKGFPFVSRKALVDHTIDTLIAGLRTPAHAPRPTVPAQSKKWDYFE
jgi:AcrR family transcriptional regulator